MNLGVLLLLCDGDFAYDDLDKAIMFNEPFSTAFVLYDGSEPAFHGSISSVFDDVQFDISDVCILCKVCDRFTLATDGIPSISYKKFAAPRHYLCTFFSEKVWTVAGCLLFGESLRYSSS